MTKLSELRKNVTHERPEEGKAYKLTTLGKLWYHQPVLFWILVLLVAATVVVGALEVVSFFV